MALRFKNRQLEKLIETSRGKSYTVVVVTGVLVILLVLGGVFPAVSAILATVAENQQRQEAIEQLESKENIIKSLAKQESEKRAVSLALDYYFPDDVSQGMIYKIIDDAVNLSGVSMLGISFDDIDDSRSLVREFKVAKGVSAKNMSISIIGERRQLEDFLVEIENSRRIINIQNISEFRQESTDTGELRMEIQAEFYFWQSNQDD